MVLSLNVAIGIISLLSDISEGIIFRLKAIMLPSCHNNMINQLYA